MFDILGDDAAHIRKRFYVADTEYFPMHDRSTDRDNISIEHHERLTPVSFEWIGVMKIKDRLSFPIFKPKVTRHFAVVLVDFAVAFSPVVKLALADADPGHDLLDGDFGTVARVIDVIDHRISRVVGNPASC